MSVSTSSRGFAGAGSTAGEAPGGLASFGGSAPGTAPVTNGKAPSPLAARSVAVRSRVGTGTGHLGVRESEVMVVEEDSREETSQAGVGDAGRLPDSSSLGGER